SGTTLRSTGREAPMLACASRVQPPGCATPCASAAGRSLGRSSSASMARPWPATAGAAWGARTIHHVQAIRMNGPSRKLDAFANPKPGRAYEVRFEAPEFTCLCPKTGQPDFATIRIRYVPDELCVELKSLKLYLWSFRDEGHFHEAVTNRILDD